MRPSRQLQPFIRPWPAGKPSVMVILMALCVATSVTQWVFAMVDRESTVSAALQATLALSFEGIRAHHYWQFLTYGTLHAGLIQLFANMAVLFFAGREVEPIVGRRHFLGIYLLGYTCGGVVQWVAMAMNWAPSGEGVALMGVSGGVAAVLAAYATILPELESTVHLFFVIPVRLRTKMVGLAGTAMALILCILDAPALAPLFGAQHELFMMSFREGLACVGPVAILAGFIGGWAYVKHLGFGNPLWIQRFIYNRRQREARMARMPAEQFISEEIDPILDKISREGMHSLSRAEKRILERGREKIAGAGRGGSKQ
jgi:membrane associated rhomboid family serine protease